MRRAEIYARSVLSGEIQSNIHTKNAVNRYYSDLERDDLEFREEEVEIVLATLESFELIEEFVGEPFILQDWQVFIIANIYGFYYKDSGKRKYTDAYIEVARKNGKSYFGAALVMYHLLFDGVHGAQCLLAANSREQAQNAFRMVSSISKQLDPKGAALDVQKSLVNYHTTSSFVKVLAADASKLDGYNCSFALIDEAHAAKNTKVWDVIKSSMGSRKNPLMITITTSGLDKSSPCYEMRQIYGEVLAGIKEQEDTFIMIYSIDANDDWKEPEKCAQKANPNLGVSNNLEFITKETKKAINNPSYELECRVKYFNDWADSEDVWLQDFLINAVTSKERLNIDEYCNPEYVCYLGVDLAATRDLTAVVILFRHIDTGKFTAIPRFYIPSSALEGHKLSDKYKEWHRNGFIEVCPGNVTDYNYITKDILDLNNKMIIETIGYDAWNSTQWAVDATELGLPLQQYKQSIGAFNAPTKELERLILSEGIELDNNPVLRWCFRNAELRRDHNGNCKPDKSNDNKKIDGVIALIQAIAMHWLDYGTVIPELQVETYQTKI